RTVEHHPGVSRHPQAGDVMSGRRLTERLLTIGLLWTIAAVLHPAEAGAQTKPKSPAPVKLITLDLAVPDSPALAILGLSPETVVRPGTPRDLATTVLNGVDRRGNLQSG